MKKILLLALLFINVFSKDLESIELLLKWKHSFQFAGYYAALEKGFYREEGLDVKLIEGDLNQDSVGFVTSKEGRYAISDSDLFYSYLNKHSVVLISQIFQHSPLVLFSHMDSNIVNPYNMNHKKVIHSNQMPIQKLLEDVYVKQYPYSKKNIQKFINKEIDVLAGYSISTLFYLKEKGIEVNVVNPQDYGIDNYGDNLFTSKRETENYSERVERMNRATIKGWEYALSHKNELIKIIEEKYTKLVSRESLEFEANEILKVIKPNLIPIGTINHHRYDELLLEHKKNQNFKEVNEISDFYFNPTKSSSSKNRLKLLDYEKEWIKSHSKIKLTGDPSWLPMEGFDSNGNYIGIVSDYLNEISSMTGIEFEILPTLRWSESIRYSRDRIVDVLSDTVEIYRDDVIFTKPYFETEVVIVMNNKQGFVNNLQDIKDSRIAIVKDYSYITKIMGEYPSLNYINVNSVEDGLKLVSRGEVDAFICTLAKASFSIPALGLSNIKIVGKTEFSTKLGFAVREDYPELVSIMNKAIDSIEQNKKKEIFNKWVKAQYVREKDYSIALYIIVISLIVGSWFSYLLYRMKKEIRLRKELEESLVTSKVEAEKANESKSEFLANMSHEIRTPMNSVIGFSELLEQTNLNSKQRDYVESIIKSSRNLLSIINDILDLSKIEAGKLLIEKDYVNIRQIINDIHQIFLLEAKQKNLFFHTEVDENVPSNIFTDEIRLRQILINLVGNAVKFTKQGHISLKVDVKNISSFCDISISVSDSGTGIDNAQIDKIFKNFEQQDGQDSRHFGGTGLGLPISQKLSKKLGGKIHVKSELNKGSTFTLKLKEIKYNNQNELNIQSSNEKEKYIFDDSLVLIVDDVKENRLLLKELLNEYSINSLEATNGKEAIEMLKNVKKNVQLILMDIRMPIMDGYEALKIIKADVDLKCIPIIAVTASMFKDEQDKIISRGFDDFLQKPILIDKLDVLLIKYLEYKHLNINESEELSFDFSDEVRNKFEEEFLPKLSNQSIINNFHLLSQLNSDIKDFANNNNNKQLYGLAKILDNYIESFDIENIKNTVEKLKVLK